MSPMPGPRAIAITEHSDRLLVAVLRASTPNTRRIGLKRDSLMEDVKLVHYNRG